MVFCKKYFCAFASLFAFTTLLLANNPILASDNKAVPLEITADHALEWNQTDQTYIARGQAKAVQGDFSVSGDLLTAEYAGKDGSTSDLTRVIAEGHVVLTSAQDRAIGDKAIYDLIANTVTLSGMRPKVIRNDDVLEADLILVTLKDNMLVRSEATGNVVITTAGTHKATSNKAIYTKATNIVELIGSVKIMQGLNWLEGDYAEMNLTSKISKVSGKKNTKRVKGIFYPSSSSQQ